MSTAVPPVHMCLRDVDRGNLFVPLHATGQLATAGFARLSVMAFLMFKLMLFVSTFFLRRNKFF